MQWEDVPEKIDEWTEKCADLSWDLRQAVSGVFTGGPVGVFYEPEISVVALRGGPTDIIDRDLALVKMAAARVVGADSVVPGELSHADLDDPDMAWVKVAVSPALRAVGETMNILPGHFPGGIPNAPSPLAATLTGGLLGAGLGYGAGWLGETLLPHKWQRGRLRKALAVGGGLLGAAPGLAWTGSALSRGNSLLDGGDTSPEPPAKVVAACDILDEIELGQRYLNACTAFVKTAYASTFGQAVPQEQPDVISVNLNQLGQTLWEVGAEPKTTAMTMGTLYAAQQLPDPNAQPGEVTPHQTGLLGTLLGAAGGGVKGYATGWAVGKALGLLTGMPSETQNTLKNTGLVLGIVHEVIPRLFQ